MMHLSIRNIAALFFAASTALAADPTAPAQFPAGHPAISPKAPASMPATATGTLTIKALPKTAGGAIPANDKVTVHFYQGDNIVKHADGVLDAQGQTQVVGINLTPTPVQALVMIQHGAVTYQAVSPEMDSVNTQGTIEIPVFETTREMPKWRVPMRHVMVSPSDKGLRVAEMIVVSNPADRTWIGSGQEDGATLTVGLPEGAGDIELGEGLSQESVHLHGNVLSNIAPMVPGTTRYEFAYTIPVQGGKAVLPVMAPADTQQLVVMVPDDGSTVQAMGLTAGATHKTEEGGQRMYQTAGLPAGKAVSLTISGLAEAVGKSAASGSMSTAQIIAVAGLAVVLVGGAASIMLKPARKSNA